MDDSTDLITMLGADPETFIVNRKTGYVVPAHKLGFPRTPLEVKSAGAVHRDGWALELNPTATHCRALLAGNLRSLYRFTLEKLGPELTLLAVPARRVSLLEMDSAPPDVKVFGCDQSLNTYTTVSSLPTVEAAKHPWRYCGGHCHISTLRRLIWGKSVNAREKAYRRVAWIAEKYEENAPKYIKLLDRGLGLPLTYLFGSPALTTRRKFYGQAGEYRLQDYGKLSFGGIEYRTPGPELFLHPTWMSLVYGVMRLIYTNFEASSEALGLPNTQQEQVRGAINAGVSHSDLLDLITTIPGYYTPDLLRSTKRHRHYESPLRGLNRHVDQALKAWPLNLHKAWGEYVAEHFFAGSRLDEEPLARKWRRGVHGV